ncbi:hypothetical protein [Azospirillum himalayense]|uniref:Uncharacterized protein n=1 Tax=Azospirillum himalayense TaxID=654847 RepID=A0ABW0GC08_9PROT
MTAKTEAIANANAHLNNVGLPTYDDMLAAAEEAMHHLRFHDDESDPHMERLKAVIAKAGGEG